MTRLRNTDAIIINEAIPTFLSREVSVIVNSIDYYHKEYVKKSEVNRKAKDAGRKRWLKKKRQVDWQ